VSGSDTEQVPWTQVDLTTRRSGRGQKFIAVQLIASTVIGIGASIVYGDEWWLILVLVVTGLIMLVIGLGLWFSADLDVEATEKLEASGIRAPAEMLSAEEVGDDDIVYRLDLRVVPPGAEAFEVSHRCRKHVCTQAAKQTPPVYLTALVDPDERTWGIVHR
jgi:hypothetical protein